MSPKVRPFFLAALAAVLVAFTGGCSDLPVPTAAAPSAPAATETADATLTSAASLDILARFNQKPQVTIAWAKKWIGPEGGRLAFQGFAVDVPAGAVSKVTMFSIRLPVDPKGSEHVVAEFGPHGSKFSRPVTISFPYRGTTLEGASSPTVVWWNNGAWVDMGGWVTADGARISTITDHFSEYGTTSARGGSMLVSGG
ncbi:MAG TPA: hypothetical protein VHG91_16920 [Longimicrobium sp.]|nr:hypothetical protein [Longimicrobium sp.]